MAKPMKREKLFKKMIKANARAHTKLNEATNDIDNVAMLQAMLTTGKIDDEKVHELWALSESFNDKKIAKALKEYLSSNDLV